MYEEGAAAVKLAIANGVPGEDLSVEAIFTLGRLLFFAGRRSEAAVIFENLELIADPAVRETGRDWAERARFGAPE